jgi:hypothetical protein
VDILTAIIGLMATAARTHTSVITIISLCTITNIRRVLSALIVSGFMLFGPFGFASEPADKAGIKAGDDIIEIAGNRIPGAKARELQSILPPKIGDLLLKLTHPGGDAYSVTLVATASPAAR